MSRYLLAIDQGTSSSRAVVYDHSLSVVSSAQEEFSQYYPEPGWVEHDPEEIWKSVSNVVSTALQKCRAGGSDVTAIGITNQRETTVVWDKRSGKSVYNAIVWQDRRTADACQLLQEQGHEDKVAELTGLRLDPYFSASKIGWILDNVDGARRRAESGELLFGTIDCFLLWRLTGGRQHATDATNASRTSLFNIHSQQWDDSLLSLFEVPRQMLPEVKDCAAEFGTSDTDCIDAAVPILSVAGDQQAALIGQAGFELGTTKSTYGTGCFAIANTGQRALRSNNKLLTTVAMRLAGEVTFGLEGSVFVAGSAMQWLRDELGIIQSAADSEAIARRTGVVHDVVVVPAFAGLGAPHWDPHARGAILGLSRGSNAERVVTATLQAVALQTVDLLAAMADDGVTPSVIRVDGGMVTNDWFLQFLADVLNITVERPVNVESTVLGVAYLAALQAGIVTSTAEIEKSWQLEKRFAPQMSDDQKQSLLANWHDAVGRVKVGR